MESAKKTSVKKQHTFEQFDLAGGSAKEVSFSKELAEAKASSALLAQYVRVYLTNQRQGTAKAKGRSEVAGTTKKVYKQKGTGKARHGSMRAPIFKGGGVVGGPLPKEYDLSINKKQRKQVLFSAIAQRMSEGAIVGLSYADTKAEPKTKKLAEFLKKMKIEDKKVLFVLPEERLESLVLSMRNLKNASYIPATNMNAYAILNAGKIIFVNDAFAQLEKHFSA